MKIWRKFNVFEQDYVVYIQNGDVAIRLDKNEIEELVKFIDKNYYIEELLGDEK